jgi:translation initiation factor 6 (eIF-6)
LVFEIVRASVVTFKGAKVAPMFPEFSAMNLNATLEVAAAMKTANGGDDPLEKKQS